jgi:hypothetical protein
MLRRSLNTVHHGQAEQYGSGSLSHVEANSYFCC